ncbi:LysR family transcriptional regulator [Streptomyces sp. NBRC 14336]|uniref:LysR family transcriptional regulator n=1 Tax=Streptomyces sp. NBRC 14336 TaxID=3030992 RepID=UPI0024A34465|nr:LysR family transcriptional regulator [Streptomyces sp. NBRC 14336]WBO80910.1 LysR family transcriptional regulator [Streptomyces sp. SBE_14.2]GLW48169.1 LysR family transcriptional regulator [Streptomyces sp. NBRC 14336]
MDGEEGTGPGENTSGLDRLASVNLNLLVPLLALLEERSVTRAAERVGLSQPAMSHALTRMRRLLGDELVVRQGAGVTLTPRALELIAPLRDVLQRTAQIVDFPSFDPATDRRVITVAMTNSTAFVVGPRLTRLVTERAPHATLRIRTITVPTEPTFTEGGVDVVLISEGHYAPYPRERLYDDRVVVVASPDTPPEASALDLLTGQPHVIVDTERRVFPYSVLEDEGIPYRVGLRVSDFLLVPFHVARAGGVALLRYRVAATMRTLAELRIEEFPFPLPGLGIDMVWNPRLADRQFANWLRELLRDAAIER